MNDNYLWDKSGEPDEEIQQLESLLSEFRYQPRPLVLPVEEPKRGLFSTLLPFFTMRYAMATAMALLVLSAGLWLLTRTAEKEQIAVQPTATSVPPREEKATVPAEQTAAPAAKAIQLAKQPATARPTPRFAKHHARTVNNRLQAEGELAKEKVLLALQLTSRQLDLISKKMHADTN